MEPRARAWTILLLAAACGPAPRPDLPEWSLSDAPILSIGSDSSAATEFHRIAGAVRLGDGEIAVANAGTSEVRYFAPDGSHRRTFGREGAGPGEFHSMGRPFRLGDTLAIYDSRNTRLTRFVRDSLLETWVLRTPNAVGRFSITDRLPDGRWLGSTGVSPHFASLPYRDSIAVGIFPAKGDGEMELLGWYPGPWIASVPDRQTGIAGFYSWVLARPVGAEIVVLDADQERLRRVGPDGVELPGGTLALPRTPLTSEIVAEARRREMVPGEDPSAQQAWLDALYDPAVLPAHLPIRSLLVDSEGLLWLEELPVTDTEPGRWFVVTPAAQVLASVRRPPGFRATDIGPGWVLGVRTDSLGVESIAMYGLIRGR